VSAKSLSKSKPSRQDITPDEARVSSLIVGASRIKTSQCCGRTQPFNGFGSDRFRATVAGGLAVIPSNGSRKGSSPATRTSKRNVTGRF
jgi:hypothetical protein